MIGNINEIDKIKRKKFFLYSCVAAAGIFSVLKNPFKIISRKNPEKESSIKITQNPNAIQRKSRQVSNG